MPQESFQLGASKMMPRLNSGIITIFDRRILIPEFNRYMFHHRWHYSVEQMNFEIRIFRLQFPLFCHLTLIQSTCGLITKDVGKLLWSRREHEICENERRVKQTVIS